MYFDDYSMDQLLTSRGRTVTETDIVNFAGISGDFIALHMDEEFARAGLHKRRIAHGALIFSISTGMMVQMMTHPEAIVAYRGIDEMRFLAPVFIGDTVHLTKKIIKMHSKDGVRGVVTFESKVINQDAKIVLEYVDRLMVLCRPV
jgi:acyl dehydratase